MGSVLRAFERLGCTPTVSSDVSTLRKASRLVIPGVGSFGRAMTRIAEARLIDALQSKAFTEEIPILGICLGMQIFAAHSQEDDLVEGLGWVRGRVVRLSPGSLPVPHIGWNRVHQVKRTALFHGIDEAAEFYFLHSYRFFAESDDDCIGYSEHGEVFPCAVNRNNIWGVQFHPEKSGSSGRRILSNFLTL